MTRRGFTPSTHLSFSMSTWCALRCCRRRSPARHLRALHVLRDETECSLPRQGRIGLVGPQRRVDPAATRDKAGAGVIDHSHGARGLGILRAVVDPAHTLSRQSWSCADQRAQLRRKRARLLPPTHHHGQVDAERGRRWDLTPGRTTGIVSELVQARAVPVHNPQATRRIG
jgi:hypothetical protein